MGNPREGGTQTGVERYLLVEPRDSCENGEYWQHIALGGSVDPNSDKVIGLARWAAIVPRVDPRRQTTCHGSEAYGRIRTGSTRTIASTADFVAATRILLVGTRLKTSVHV